MDWSYYWISDEEFGRLWSLYGPFSGDFFASDLWFRMKPYFARFASGESEGVDVFSVSWEGRRGYFHPPVVLIWKVIRKAEREKAEGILIAPDWPGSSFCSLVEE